MKLFAFVGIVTILTSGCRAGEDESNLNDLNAFDAGFNLTSLAAGVECGIRNEGNIGLIVGGVESRPNSWPWAIALKKNGRFICGGSIISERYILTAAHCVRSNGYTQSASALSVVVGAHDIARSGHTIQVERVTPHQFYDETAMQNDIAILRLRRPIDFKSMKGKARPVCLPTAEMDNINFIGKQSIIVGWGTTSEGGRVAQRLREVAVPIITNSECSTSYDPTMIRDKQICAGYQKGGKDSCQGDSGGSLTLPQLKTMKYYQLGVVSWGAGCARAGAPGVYTRVTKYISWIQSNAR